MRLKHTTAVGGIRRNSFDGISMALAGVTVAKHQLGPNFDAFARPLCQNCPVRTFFQLIERFERIAERKATIS